MCPKSEVLLVFVLFISYLECWPSNWESELMRMRKTGELRKACSKHGNAIQPNARINTTERLFKLRRLMINETVTKGIKIDAYIIPSLDEHQTESVAEYDTRREHISGFSGSAGDAIVTATKAALWTDGRYHLQADDQLDCNWLLMRQNFANVPEIPQWLEENVPSGGIVAVDPKLIAQSTWQVYEKTFREMGLVLTDISTNLVDLLWTKDRYPKRNKDAFILDKAHSGRDWTSKVGELREHLTDIQADAMIITSLDEIAWLLNLRGRDIPYSPFLRCYAFVDRNEIRLFVNETQLAHNNIRGYFNRNRNQSNQTIRIFPYESVCVDLSALSQVYRKILVPGATAFGMGASRYIYTCIPEEKTLVRQSPIVLMKALKNPIEVKGMYRAHIRDAAALCEFFSYFETRVKSGKVFTELEVVKIMNEFRFEQRYSLGNSFRTIAGYGTNGAHPHYEPTPNTNAKIFDNSTLVLDSGGQYYDGTTDVTRTLHLGIPTAEEKEAYTRVLMGQIQLALLTFPETMATSVADVVARAPLWEIGLDYMHGTSHGIGSFLNVHESPILMHYGDFRPEKEQQLKPTYFLSNEPGYYKEGDFGIRLENVMEVVEKPWLHHSSGRAFLGFKTVTLVPYEPKLIDLSLLSVHQRRWINSYNERIRIQVGAELKKQNLMSGFYWMMEKTENIPEYGNGYINHPKFSLISTTLACIIFIFY